MISLIALSLLGSALLPLVGVSLHAEPAAPRICYLWPGNAPGEKQVGLGTETVDGGVTRLTDVYTPRMLIFEPQNVKKPAPALLIFPGGGYQILAQDLEGTEIAHWANSLGFVAVVLDYRVPNNADGAFQDAQRGLSLLRCRSRDYGIDPEKIGVIGFSAGGDLAARLSANYTQRAYSVIDSCDKASCRPDFTLLIYPAYLLSPNGKAAANVAPHPGMPPTFLVQTKDDPYLDAPGYADALRAAGVSEELHLYPSGGHGYGLRLPADNPASKWPVAAAAWMRSQLRSGGKSAIAP